MHGMEAGDPTVGQTTVISPTLPAADVPAVCPGPAGVGIHPCSLDIQTRRSVLTKLKYSFLYKVEVLYEFCIFHSDVKVVLLSCGTN